MSTLTEFQALAQHVGIALPTTLIAIMQADKNSYPPYGVADYDALYAANPPAFESWLDFEWITPQVAQREIDQWLDAKHQHGNRFLPFAQSGAGDAYCLVQLKNGAQGVCMVWHDDATSSLKQATFDDFIIAQYLQTFATLGDAYYGETPETCASKTLADVNLSAAFLPAQKRDYLLQIIANPPQWLEYKMGPKAAPQQMYAFISQAQETSETAHCSITPAIEFNVVSPWDIA